MGDNWPTENKIITPYIIKSVPDISKEIKVKVLDVKRNFIEKLLILHSIYHRPLNKGLKTHYSRHYYDVYILIKNNIGKEALKFPDIFAAVYISF